MHVLQTTVQHPSDPSIRTTWLPSLPPGLLPALRINLDPSYDVLSLCVHIHRILSVLHPLPIKKAIHSSKLRMSAVQFSSVAQSCLTLCSPMDCSTPGLPVHHQLPEPTQTHVHSVSNAIQPSHSRSSPFPPVFNFSQHQGLFQWTGSSHQVAKVLEFQLKHQSFQWILNLFPLGWTGWISLQSKGLSRVFSSTTVQKHQFFGAQLSSQSNSHIHTWLLEKP